MENELEEAGKGCRQTVMHVGLRPGLDLEKRWVGNPEVSGFRGDLTRHAGQLRLYNL